MDIAEFRRETERQTLRNEYNAIESTWRTLLVLEFTILAFAVTFTATLVGAHQYVITHIREFGYLGKVGLVVAMPATGILLSFFATITTGHIRILYRTSIMRGIEIEYMLGLRNGHFYRLWTVAARLLFRTSTMTALVVYVFALVTWLYLLYNGVERYLQLLREGIPV